MCPNPSHRCQGSPPCCRFALPSSHLYGGLIGDKRSGDLSFSFAFPLVRYCFLGGIDEVVATITCLNKFSLDSSYLDRVRSDADEGLVRVCVTRSVGSWHLVCLSRGAIGWLLVWFLQLSGPMVMDYKPVLRGVMLEPMFAQRLIYLISKDEWLLQSLKIGTMKAFAGVPFIYCWFNAIHNFQLIGARRILMERKGERYIRFNI